MSEMIERVALELHDEWNGVGAWASLTGQDRKRWRFMARAATEAIPLEQIIRDAYVRGVEWAGENPNATEYRFKAAADYADKTLSPALNEGG